MPKENKGNLIVFDTFDKLLRMFLLQTESLEEYKDEVGASAEDIAEVNRDAAIMRFIDDYQRQVSHLSRVITGIKNAVYKGKTSDGAQHLPDFPAPAPPFELIAGCLERATERNRRFRAAKGYTAIIGATLGIVENNQSIAPETVTPRLEITATESNHEADVIVRYRGKSDMWRLFERRLDSQKSIELASGTGRTARVKITPVDEKLPERMLVQIRLYRKNEPYGQPSNFTYVTFNP